MTTINTNPYLATADDSAGQTINNIPYLVKLSGGAGVTSGYYYNNKFYSDAAHTKEITPKANQLYMDVTSGNYKLYTYTGDSYVIVSGGGSVTVGRFLSAWNCETGLPVSFPESTPYTYKTGDFYIVTTVSDDTNYKPNGSSYTGTASITEETGTVNANDFYFYDGSIWLLLKNTAKINDIQIDGYSIVDNGIANIESEPLTFTYSDGSQGTIDVLRA